MNLEGGKVIVLASVVKSDPMAAFFSGLVNYLLHPLVWISFLIFLSIILRRPKGKKFTSILALILLFLFTNPFLFRIACKAWEPEPLAIEELEEQYDYGVVLGGFTSLWSAPTDRLHLNGHANRFTAAIELYHAGKVKHLLFVSGATTSSSPRIAEATLAARSASRYGVPRESVTALPKSRNTAQNASECLEFLEEKNEPQATLLVITSALHAHRAEKHFEAIGLPVRVFPTDHQTGRGKDRIYSLSDYVLPNPGTVNSWKSLLHEWVGMLAQRFQGDKPSQLPN